MVKMLPEFGQAVKKLYFTVDWARLSNVRGALTMISVNSIIFQHRKRRPHGILKSIMKSLVD